MDDALILDILRQSLKGLDVKLDDPTLKLSHSNPKKTLFQHVKECIEAGLKLLKLHGLGCDCCKKLLECLCVLHDYGKLSTVWGFDKSSRVSHSLLSFLFALEYLHEAGESGHGACKNFWFSNFLPYLVQSHHGILDLWERRRIVKFLRSNLGKLNISSVETLRRLERLAISYHRSLFSELLRLDENGRVLIADVFGVFKTADLLSSIFSMDETMGIIKGIDLGLDLADFKMYLERRASEKNIIFDAKKFVTQNSLVGRYDDVLVAPTGWGKTVVSVTKFIKLGPARFFYVLPTISAIRQIRDFFLVAFGGDSVGEFFYFADVDFFSDRVFDNVSLLHREFELDRLFLRKVNIITVDQFLFSMVLLGKYFLRRYGFRNALIVFDEFHSLSPEMFLLLKWILENYRKRFGYNFKLLLMSATPNRVYIDYLSSVSEKVNLHVIEDAYNKLKRHMIRFVDEPLINFISGDGAKLLEKHRVLIIVNTVKKAIKVYEAIKNMRNLKGKKIGVIHSRFTFGDRLEKESKIENADILVSTQVAEVSLDISYDILITERAPIPSLVQRMGRVNRYGESGVPDKPNVYICREEFDPPYDSVEMDLTRQYLDELVVGYNKFGEVALLKFYMENEEFLDRIKRGLKLVSGKISHISKSIEEDALFFYSFKEKVREISSLWREKANILVIPHQYEKQAVKLAGEMKQTREYGKRLMLRSKLKKLLVTVPLNIIGGRYKIIDGIPYPITIQDIQYNQEKGLLI